jgi:hypothetical protein
VKVNAAADSFYAKNFICSLLLVQGCKVPADFGYILPPGKSIGISMCFYQTDLVFNLIADYCLGLVQIVLFILKYAPIYRYNT